MKMTSIRLSVTLLLQTNISYVRMKRLGSFYRACPGYLISGEEELFRGEGFMSRNNVNGSDDQTVMMIS